MNGRVYDPLTAFFFSPDPYIQAPGNWLNYNRYAYGNPFKYTDPDGEFIYIIPSISLSPAGGLNVSVSAGFGIYGIASIGGTVGYNFKNNSWNFTGDASLMGVYIYGGYNTNAGWIAGGGFGFGLPGQNGNLSVNTNLTSAGVSWSQNGGWSANFLGMHSGESGLTFDPSVGVSYKVNIEVVKDDINSLGVCKMNESCFKSKSEYLAYLKSKGFEDGKYHIDKYEYQEMTIDSDGKVRGGTTKAIFINNKLIFQSIIMQPHSTIDLFIESFNHELIHAYDNYKYGYFDARKSYTETKAYRWTDRYLNHSTMPQNIPYYNGMLKLYDLPTYLIPTPSSYLPMKIF